VPLRVGLIGGSAILQRAVLPALRATTGIEVAVLASRTDCRRRELGEQFGLRTVPDYEPVLTDPLIDAVYISLPCALHEEWAARALEAGKHVYCEKPAVLSTEGAARLARLARERGRVLFEGFVFLFHPQHAEVRRLIAAGAIGRPLHVDGWFGFPPLDPSNIRCDPALGGGALNDAAGYPIHAARLIFGAEPERVSGTLFRRQPDGVDERGVVALEFAGAGAAQAVFGWGFGYRNAYAVMGSEGSLLLERAFSVPPDRPPTVVLRDRNGREEARRLEPANHFRLAIQAFDSAVRGEQPIDAFLGDFVALARILDEVRRRAQLRLLPSPSGGGQEPA
jgi:predicted dehydrogenase